MATRTTRAKFLRVARKILRTEARERFLARSPWADWYAAGMGWSSSIELPISPRGEKATSGANAWSL